jgi:hypothetical protein
VVVKERRKKAKAKAKAESKEQRAKSGERRGRMLECVNEKKKMHELDEDFVW